MIEKVLSPEAVREHLVSLGTETPDEFREDAIATFWRQATPGTTYWRGIIPMRYLPGSMVALEQKYINVHQDRGPNFLELEKQQGVAIWQFLGDDKRSRIALQLRRQGVPTFMEVDDNYTVRVPGASNLGVWRATHKEAEAAGTHYSNEMHRKLLPEMDGIIASTDWLADVIYKYNKNVHVCENAIDPTDWDVEREESDIIRVGYYASASHASDWQFVKKAINKIQKRKDAEVILIGYKPHGWQGKHIGWENSLMKARSHLGKIDIGICPLKPNKWSNSKSDLKALEYAMAGVVPVVSRTESYKPWWQHSWPLVAQEEDEWVEILMDLIRNPDKIQLFANTAKEYVLRKRTIQDNIWKWRVAIGAGSP